MRRVLLFGALVGLVGVLGACSATSDDDGDGGVTVFYTVSDSAGSELSLTYTNADGNTEQRKVTVEALSPWELKLEMERGDFVYISAQRGDGTGTVRCTITAGGERIERAESEGEFVIASCSGSVP
jgi:hypothetical protein